MTRAPALPIAARLPVSRLRSRRAAWLGVAGESVPPRHLAVVAPGDAVVSSAAGARVMTRGSVLAGGA